MQLDVFLFLGTAIKLSILDNQKLKKIFVKIFISIILHFILCELILIINYEIYMSVLQKIESLGMKIPEIKPALFSYEPTVQSGNLIYVSGQLPRKENGEIFTGKLGLNASLEDGKSAAKSCILYTIAVLKKHLELNGKSLEDIKRIVKISVFVNASESFTDHPAVANGASDLLIEIFGDKGRHARAAIGHSSLPLGAAVEIESIVEIQ